jgi:predicted nucleic acid-binding Zn ribbon protein
MLKREKSRKLEPVGKLLADVLERLGLAGQLAEQRAVQIWPQTVGEKIAAHTRAHAIENGELVVLVDAHAWIQELSFLKPGIIAKLNQALGSEIVKDIRFTLMRRPKL